MRVPVYKLPIGHFRALVNCCPPPQATQDLHLSLFDSYLSEHQLHARRALCHSLPSSIPPLLQLSSAWCSLKPPQWHRPFGLCTYSGPAGNLPLSANKDLIALPRCTFSWRSPIWMKPRLPAPHPFSEFPQHSHTRCLLLSIVLLLFHMRVLVSPIEMWALRRAEAKNRIFYSSFTQIWNGQRQMQGQ